MQNWNLLINRIKLTNNTANDKILFIKSNIVLGVQVPFWIKMGNR